LVKKRSENYFHKEIDRLLSAFNNERRSIKLTLLYNGFVRYIHFFFPIFYLFSPSYPPRYIHWQFIKFFSFHFQTSDILPTIKNENTIRRLHYLFVNTPTISEYQIATRIARAIKQNPTEQLDNSLVRFQLKKKQIEQKDHLLIHYVYEKRLRNNKKDIHQLWNQIFKETPVLNTRLIIGNRNNHNLIQEIVQRHPRSSNVQMISNDKHSWIHHSETSTEELFRENLFMKFLSFLYSIE